MSDESVPVTVKILDKEYRVASPPHERDALLAAASHLNQRMREIRDSGKVVGAERIAVMAALNLAHELLQAQAHNEQQDREAHTRIQRIEQKVETALTQGRQIEL